jgi:hypothetical protein
MSRLGDASVTLYCRGSFLVDAALWPRKAEPTMSPTILRNMSYLKPLVGTGTRWRNTTRRMGPRVRRRDVQDLVRSRRDLPRVGRRAARQGRSQPAPRLSEFR